MATRGWQGVSAADLARMQRKGPPQVKPSKYRNVRVMVDGESFDSKREAQHWAELKMQQKAGQITNLRRQVKFGLWAAAVNDDGTPRTPCAYASAKIADYVADFVFTDAGGVERIQDVKGGKVTRTAVYRLKVKWLLWQSGIEIEEIG